MTTASQPRGLRHPPGDFAPPAADCSATSSGGRSLQRSSPQSVPIRANQWPKSRGPGLSFALHPSNFSLRSSPFVRNKDYQEDLKDSTESELYGYDAPRSPWAVYRLDDPPDSRRVNFDRGQRNETKCEVGRTKGEVTALPLRWPLLLDLRILLELTGDTSRTRAAVGTCTHKQIMLD